MKKYFLYAICIVILLFAFTGCKLFNSSKNEDINMDDLVANPEFQFNTIRSVEIELTSYDRYGFLMPKAHFELWKDDPSKGGTKKILSNRTDENSHFVKSISLPTYYNSIFLKSGNIVQQLTLDIENSTEGFILDYFICIPPQYPLNKSYKFDSQTESDNGYDFTLENMEDNCNGTTTITIRVQNNNNRGLSHIAVSLPVGVVPSQPTDGSTYHGDEEDYIVENPTNNPFYSIKYETEDDEGIKNGVDDVFRYIIPTDDAEDMTELTIQAKAANIIGEVTFTVDYTATCNDSDGDGVTDDWDDYPDDPDRAFNEYTPAEGQYGTFMWEDLWPDKGDYDMNDLVMDYNVIEVYNADWEIVEVINNFYLRAAGAGFLDNGFAIQYPDYWQIDGTIEDDLGLAYADTDNRTVIFFTNHRQVFGVTGGEWINTYPPYDFVPTVTWSVTIPMQEIWKNKMVAPPWFLAPFNPFLTQNGVRSHEIHLPDYPHTASMNTALFGTGDDATDPSEGIYFRTENYLPWAVLIAESSDYAIERIQISDAFNYFVDWVDSDGWDYDDWYLDLPGYQNEDLIYHVPE